MAKQKFTGSPPVTDGSLADWQVLSANLPSAGNVSHWVAANNYLYAVGENPSTIGTSTLVYTARFNADGTDGAFATVTGPSVTNLLDGAVATWGASVYVFGDTGGPGVLKANVAAASPPSGAGAVAP